MDNIYLESSVISYLASEPSKDVLVFSRQLISKEWWKEYSQDYIIYISQPVISEISKGNPEQSEKKINLIKKSLNKVYALFRDKKITICLLIHYYI